VAAVTAKQKAEGATAAAVMVAAARAEAVTEEVG